MRPFHYAIGLTTVLTGTFTKTANALLLRSFVPPPATYHFRPFSSFHPLPSRNLHHYSVPSLPCTPLRAINSETILSSPAKIAAPEARSAGLFVRTPLLLSRPLTKLTGDRHPVYLKLDCLQPSGSFKDRGMAHLCTTLRATKNTNKLISSSGGNAGLAVSTVGAAMGMDVSVIVPETTKTLVLEKLRTLGAEVTVHGKNWNEADGLARDLVADTPGAEYVSPYDNPLLWTGHSTAIDEILEDLPEEDLGCVVASVGGGGLLCGVLEGLARHGSRAKVVAAETEGAASYAAAREAGGPVRLNAITSVATSLGALEVTPVAVERAESHENVDQSVCTDAEAVEACVRLAADHRLLVEPACGAALAALYSERLRSNLLERIEKGSAIVVEVCGGSGVDIDLLDIWRKEYMGETE